MPSQARNYEARAFENQDFYNYLSDPSTTQQPAYHLSPEVNTFNTNFISPHSPLNSAPLPVPSSDIAIFWDYLSEHRTPQEPADHFTTAMYTLNSGFASLQGPSSPEVDPLHTRFGACQSAADFSVHGWSTGNIGRLLEVDHDLAEDLLGPFLPRTSTLRRLACEYFPTALALSFINDHILIELPETSPGDHEVRLEGLACGFWHGGPALFYYNGSTADAQRQHNEVQTGRRFS
jgi:hypothetical protein